MKNLDLAISQLESIIIPFAYNHVWELVHTHMKLYPNQPMGKYKEEPAFTLHYAWWEYFSNLDVKASIVFDLIRATGGDVPFFQGEAGEPVITYYIREVEIDLEKDTWVEAFSKLNKSTWDSAFDWFVWLVHSEFLFEYNCQDDPLVICTSYVKHLEAHINQSIEDYIHYQK
jgi:hypothetical protein